MRFAIALGAISLCVGCATMSTEAPMSSTHSAYTGKPPYLGVPVLPRPKVVGRQGGSAPLHADAPAVADSDEAGDDSDAPNTPNTPNTSDAPAPQGNDSAPVDTQQPVNRQPEAANPWQPTVITPDQAPTNPN